MGMTAEAKLAWGVDLGDPDNTSEGFDWDEAGIDSWDFEEKEMPVLFGFTEEPPVWPESLERGTKEAREWWEVNRKPYNERREAAIPLKFEHYGYERGGMSLVLKRSLTDVDWGCEAVDVATLAAPGPDETAAFTKILNRLGFQGGAPQLLLMASYG